MARYCHSNRKASRVWGPSPIAIWHMLHAPSTSPSIFITVFVYPEQWFRRFGLKDKHGHGQGQAKQRNTREKRKGGLREDGGKVWGKPQDSERQIKAKLSFSSRLSLSLLGKTRRTAAGRAFQNRQNAIPVHPAVACYASLDSLMLIAHYLYYSRPPPSVRTQQKRRTEQYNTQRSRKYNSWPRK